MYQCREVHGWTRATTPNPATHSPWWLSGRFKLENISCFAGFEGTGLDGFKSCYIKKSRKYFYFTIRSLSDSGNAGIV
jgi:hypothetical protein